MTRLARTVPTGYVRDDFDCKPGDDDDPTTPAELAPTSSLRWPPHPRALFVVRARHEDLSAPHRRIEIADLRRCAPAAA